MTTKGYKFPNRKKALPRTLESRMKQSKTHKLKMGLGLYKHRSWNKGTKGLISHSKETKEKISKSLKGKVISEKTRIKLQLRLKRMGKDNPYWKGGVTSENKRIRTSIEMRLWSESVLARDNWICQKYGTKGGVLHAHHILNFSTYKELRFAIDNGITLSKKAHKEFHKKYGTKNNTKQQLEEFIKRVWV